MQQKANLILRDSSDQLNEVKGGNKIKHRENVIAATKVTNLRAPVTLFCLYSWITDFFIPHSIAKQGL